MTRSALQKVREAPASTKARILAAAEEVFALKGFDGASTREISAAAGVNISSLHYHWESKETLYYAVFQNIYDSIVEVVRSSIPHPADGVPMNRSVVDQAMARLFDFFADHPNIPKLLVRRLLESADANSEIERDILVPAWRLFSEWTNSFSGQRLEETESQIFMLTVHSVLLLFLLDSQQYVSLLGGSARSPQLRPRIRQHIIGLVHRLMTAPRAGEGT